MPAMYVERVSRPSFFSRLDVRTKLMIMFLVSTLIFVWESVFYQAALFLAVLALLVSAHVELAYIRRGLTLMTPFAIINLLIHGLWNEIGHTPIAVLPEWVPLLGARLGLYWEGLVFGLMIDFRMLATFFVLPLIVLTTDINDLVVGLVRLRIPYKVAFVFSIALRFVPFLFSEINAITEAQRLRGLAMEKMNVIRRIPVFATLSVPLIVGTLLKAQTIEVVLQSKAFSGNPRRTYLNDIALRPVDYAILALGAILFVAAVATRVVWGWGAFVA
jgi:energy-coupling factor transport system permease protein